MKKKSGEDWRDDLEKKQKSEVRSQRERER